MKKVTGCRQKRHQKWWKKLQFLMKKKNQKWWKKSLPGLLTKVSSKVIIFNEEKNVIKSDEKSHCHWAVDKNVIKNDDKKKIIKNDEKSHCRGCQQKCHQKWWKKWPVFDKKRNLSEVMKNVTDVDRKYTFWQNCLQKNKWQQKRFSQAENAKNDQSIHFDKTA